MLRINRLTRYLQCDECKQIFHSKKCAALRKTRDKKRRLCEDCFPRCAQCYRVARRGVECEHCNKYYCFLCFSRYFNVDEKTKDEPYDLRSVPPLRVDKCLWCSGEKVDMAPVLMDDTNVPENACVWCWTYGKRCIPATMKSCKCDLKNLCQPHADDHNCEGLCYTQHVAAYIDQHPERVKDHIYSILKDDPRRLAPLCYNIVGFPVK